MGRRKKLDKEAAGRRSVEHKRLENQWLSYDHFWSTIKSKYKLNEGLKDALWKFLITTGLDKPEKFEEGLQRFGIKR